MLLRVTPPSCGAIDEVVPIVKATTPLGSVLRDGNNSFDVEVIVFFTASGPFSGHITVDRGWDNEGAYTSNACIHATNCRIVLVGLKLKL